MLVSFRSADVTRRFVCPGGQWKEDYHFSANSLYLGTATAHRFCRFYRTAFLEIVTHEGRLRSAGTEIAACSWISLYREYITLALSSRLSRHQRNVFLEHASLLRHVRSCYPSSQKELDRLTSLTSHSSQPRCLAFIIPNLKIRLGRDPFVLEHPGVLSDILPFKFQTRLGLESF